MAADPLPRMFGVETEYAFVARAKRGCSIERDQILHEVMHAAKERLPHLAGIHDTDLYLANGSRLYVDTGGHPELCTPECTNPWDVVRYILAGERLLADLCMEVESRVPELQEVLLLKCNVDYTGARTTWGSHESYLHTADPKTLAEQLVPFLVSRMVYAGAGGFDSRSLGLEFMLSPRAAHITHVVSPHSTGERGIVHTKEESLCRGAYRRLHLLCGESLCSEVATWLRIGATALVVALVENGRRPGEAVALQSPVEALQTFARDPNCSREVPLANRPPMGAVAIQRHYLGFAEDCLGQPFMPPWAETVCRVWREMLDRLENAARSMSSTLDWAIKRDLFEKHTQRKGIDQRTWAPWTTVLRALRAALDETPYKGKKVRIEVAIAAESPIRDDVQRLTSFLDEHALRWDLLRPFMDYRQELFEIDLRFGRVGRQGLFAALDESGVLAHHFPGVDNIEHAMANPPAEGRARLRGEAIREHLGRPHYRCGWDSVWDQKAGRVLDLADPFAREKRWKKMGASDRLRSVPDLFRLFGFDEEEGAGMGDIRGRPHSE